MVLSLSRRALRAFCRSSVIPLRRHAFDLEARRIGIAPGGERLEQRSQEAFFGEPALAAESAPRTAGSALCNQHS